MKQAAFMPESTYGDVPYRVVDGGQVDALIGGRVVRFKTVEQLMAVVSIGTVVPAEPVQNIKSTQSSAEYTVAPQTALAAKKSKKKFAWLLAIVLSIIALVHFNSGGGKVANNIVTLLNTEYGAISNSKLEGWRSDTLRVDWTSRTNKLNVMVVFAAVATAKSALYEDGVRYFKFPNDAGGYNIIDWKSGGKTSVRERAPYYFP
jgi:hypothetical protein